MRVVRFLSWAAVLFCACVLIADDQPEAPATFTVQVNTVSIDVEVLDKDGVPVLGLDQSDFVVKENGHEVKISNFSRWTDRPVSLAIILDTSTITLDKLSIAKEHIMQMLHIFDGKDELSLFSFDHRNAWLEADLTHDKKQIIDALDNISVPSRRRGGGSAEYFGKLPYTALAIDKALLNIEKSSIKRKTLLVISNRFRGLGPATVDHIRDSECTLFTLAFTNKAAAIITILGDRIHQNRLMRDSGGRKFSAENENISETCRILVSTLKNYYSIGYQTEIKPGDKNRRRIEVKMPGKKYVINARRFYTPKSR
ncbi:MAG: VWA domain-containing protein [Acidobacteriota bacterium]|jgi:VWFA-related protein|nr:VWA domain-containing protein [Acidobacteriota bacterium]